MNRDLCGVEPRARGHTNAGHKERERARANHIRRVLHCARGWSVGCVRLRKAEVTEGAMSRLHSLCSFGDEHASCSDRSLTVNPLRFRPPLRFLRPTDGDNGAVGAWANLCRKCPSSVERRFRRQRFARSGRANLAQTYLANEIPSRRLYFSFFAWASSYDIGSDVFFFFFFLRQKR